MSLIKYWYTVHKKIIGYSREVKNDAMKTMEDARVVGVEDWLGHFYPSGKILLLFLI
jgi:hypothetical protein